MLLGASSTPASRLILNFTIPCIHSTSVFGSQDASTPFNSDTPHHHLLGFVAEKLGEKFKFLLTNQKKKMARSSYSYVDFLP
jgi:hypothetical protein